MSRPLRITYPGGKARGQPLSKEIAVDNVLIKDGEKYRGQYVATRSFKNKKVVCHGVDPDKVFNAAKEKGVKAPVVFYIPKKGMVQIY